MKRTAVLLTATALALTTAIPALAAPTVLTTNLSGANENPVVITPGTGFAVVTVDPTLNTFRLQTTFSNLIGLTTAAHVHCCAPAPANAPVATPVPTFPAFPLGVASGTYDMTFDISLASFYNPAFVTSRGGSVAQARTDFLAGLLGGNSYLNIHTSAFPGGEIRGQLTPVPEPALWTLMITGFGIVGAAMRRRSRIKISYSA